MWGLPLRFTDDSQLLITLDYETDITSGGYAGDGSYGGFEATALVWWDFHESPARRVREIPLQPETTNAMMTAQLSPDGDDLVIGGQPGVIHRYDAQTGSALAPLFEIERYVVALAYSPDGNYLGFVGGQCGYMHLPTGRIHLGASARATHISKPAFSPDGRWFVYSPFDGTIQVMDLKNPDKWQVIEGNKASAKYLSFSADSRTLAGGDRSGLVRLWDMATFRELANFPLDRFCAFSPDGRTLIGGALEISVLQLAK